MATLVSRGYSSQDAADFKARTMQSHTVQWKADSFQGQSGGGVTQLATDIPIVGGTLVIDSSDPIRRKLTLEVAGADKWADSDPNSPLVPYGQFLRLYLRIDRADGSWFPWLQMGEMPIRSYMFERPSMICTVECTDWSGPVDDYLHTRETSYDGKTLRNAVVQMVNDALPFKSLNVQASDASKTKKVSLHAQAATPRWERAQAMCDNNGQECLFAANGDLIIRKDRIDLDDDGVVEAVGPDVGTRGTPVATITDGTDGTNGNLIASTLTITREGGCNGVFFPLSKPAQKKDKTHPAVAEQFYTAQKKQTTGPVAWGDKFGYIPSVAASKQVKKLDTATKTDYDNKAAARLRKRRGVLRQIDLDAVGLWWVEADDLVKIKIAGTSDDYFVSAITFDLSSSNNPTRLAIRQLNVVGA